MATKTRGVAMAAASVNNDISEEEIGSMGCWSGRPPVPTYIARRDFEWLGQKFPKGTEVAVSDPNTARKLIQARYLIHPLEVS